MAGEFEHAAAGCYPIRVLRVMVGGLAVAAAVMAWSTDALADEPYEGPPDALSQDPRRLVEAGVLVGPTLDNRRVAALSTNVMLRYFFEDDWAIGVEGSLLTAVNARDELERWETERMGFGGQLSWNGYRTRLGDGAHPALELYLLGGLGIISSKPSPLSRTRGTSVALSTLVGAGGGIRLSLSNWVTTVLEVRDDLYLGTELRTVGSARLGLSFTINDYYRSPIRPSRASTSASSARY